MAKLGFKGSFDNEIASFSVSLFLFYGLLMTTKNIFPKYTIKIKPEWLTKTPHKEGYFATHIMEPFTMNDVLKRTNTFLKTDYFPLIRNKIIQSVFYNG